MIKLLGYLIFALLVAGVVQAGMSNTQKVTPSQVAENTSELLVSLVEKTSEKIKEVTTSSRESEVTSTVSCGEHETFNDFRDSLNPKKQRRLDRNLKKITNNDTVLSEIRQAKRKLRKMCVNG